MTAEAFLPRIFRSHERDDVLPARIKGIAPSKRTANESRAGFNAMDTDDSLCPVTDKKI
jgi:hypothetical protein